MSRMKIPDPYLPHATESAILGGMNNIRNIRILRDMTQSELADLIGVKQPHMSRIEKGDEGPPLSLFRRIARALDVPLADLFDDQQSATIRRVVDVLRNLPPDNQALVVAMIDAAASQTPPVGQQDNQAGQD